MHGIIVAGGLGTRMASITNNSVPKLLLPIMNKPLIDYQLELFHKNGINNIIIAAGISHEKIKIYIDSNAQKFSKLSITIIGESSPLGSGGCLKLIEEFRQSLILFGDIAVDPQMNLKDLYTFHNKHKSHTSIVLQYNTHPQDSDLIILNSSNKVTKIICKPHKYNIKEEKLYMIAGMFLLEGEIMQGVQKDIFADLVHDIITPAIRKNRKIYGYFTDSYLNDIGTPERYSAVNQYFKENI